MQHIQHITRGLMLSFFCFQAIAQQGGIHGQVTDSFRKPLPFASVILRNTNYSTLTDENGKYELRNLPAGNYQADVSYVGFETGSLKIALQTEVLQLDFILEENGQELQEVTVKAVKQSEVQESKAMAIKSINIKEVITQNSLLTDVIDRVSGVRIRRSGSLGDPSDISINGMRGNAIRIYIDGLPMEFLYPNFDVSTLPLSSIKRTDIFKGVLPVDVGTDAMGGAVNIITEQRSHSHARASYSLGSFNTHLADVEIGLAGKKNAFINLNASLNYSDNNYSMDALVFEKNKTERVRRFHDAYKMAFTGLALGVHSKPWADELRFTANYSTGYKELQNGARVSIVAIGEALYEAENVSLNLKYEKSFLNERLKVNTIGNFSYQRLDFTDTTSNIYSWSGQVVGRNTPGEYFGQTYNTTYFNNKINRTGLSYTISKQHKLMFSNLFAHQQLTGTNYLKKPDERDYLKEPQYLSKNIAGLQYDGSFTESFSGSAAVKRYDYEVLGAENNTFLPVKKRDAFWSWNAGLKYAFSHNFFVRASYERGFLIPLFQQFVGNGADIVRNTELKPESSDNVNLGISWNRQLSRVLKMSTSMNAFWREQYDIIFLGSSITRRYENADQVNTLGIEGDFVLNYGGNWNWRTNITALRKQFTAVANPRNAFLIGSSFPNNPTFFANTELEWQKKGLFQTTDLFRVYAYYQYVAPFNHILIGQEDNSTNNPNAFVPVQHRVDVGTSYKFAKPAVTLAFNVFNVFNASLFDNFLVPRSGISFNTKLIYEINKL